MFSRKKQSKDELQDKLLSAVVSIYLYMARTAKLKGAEINFIDRILHSMFGGEIPLYKIEQARQKALSLREAANFLNRTLNSADRTKIILNLISLAYYERSKINVLGSVEIVVLVDLLRLDVNLLDAIYDLFEGKNDFINLPLSFKDMEMGFIRNSMLWSAEGGDFKFRGPHNNAKILFIMIESLVLVNPGGQGDESICSLVEGTVMRTLEPGHFHRLQENSIIVLQGAKGEIPLQTKELWTIYNLSFSAQELHYPEFQEGKLKYKNRKFWLESKTKTSFNQTRELALDDPVLDSSKTLLQILVQEESEKEDLIKEQDYYLCSNRQGLYLSDNSCAGAILHFYSQEEKLKIEKKDTSEVFLNRIPLTGSQTFTLNQDIISIAQTNYLINRNWELIEIPLQIENINVAEISHQFKDGTIGLASISFQLSQGTMMAVMGSSGSGKTTLLQILLGDITATHNAITVNGLDFNSNFAFFRKYIGYVPQDDLLFPNLTVYENLLYRVHLALPNLKNKEEIKNRIHNLLHTVGLYEQRNMLVGDTLNKKLSGGQRRRLNIALELVLNPMIIILDEPTSGLSSKDSENIAEFLSELKQQNKIIICTIHQPNATVFNFFDSVLLLDKGGRQVYFGSSKEVFNYFEEELAQSGKQKETLSLKRQLLMPDYCYDIIELTDSAGNRKFPSEYWQRKYRNYRFQKAMDTDFELSAANVQKEISASPQEKTPYHFSHLVFLTARNFLNKSRSKLNLMLTLLAAPLLAFITAFMLRNVQTGEHYSFGQNQNSWLFGFISVLIFIFIGLANSIDDILSEKRSIMRELKLNVSALQQLFAKGLVLFIMTLIQVLLYYFISALILGLRGLLVPHCLFLLLSGIIGYSIGLMFSSIIKDRSAVINILPLVIIPQILFSGAVIQFADMNSALRINKKSEIPEFCHFVPSRWLYEGWMISSATLNAIQRENRKFHSLSKDASVNYQTYMQAVETHNAFLEKHPASKYGNDFIKQAISIADGQYLNEQRNIFLSPQIKLGGKEVSTLFLDIVIALFMACVFGFVTWLRLRYYFK
jgi:ABC-type multidrug transport system ATPase subunit